MENVTGTSRRIGCRLPMEGVFFQVPYMDMLDVGRTAITRPD